jgi:triosephosphate isomerase (TIM)
MRKLIAGNWKMNGLRADGTALGQALRTRHLAAAPGCELLICPPATLLTEIASLLAGSGIALGGQDCHPDPSGAHTGDISAAMLKDVGCAYVILGHSERRHEHHETSGLVRRKVEAAWANELIPIVCVGETAAERDAGHTLAVIGEQLSGSLPASPGARQLVIAYEPVWAIGTGRTPKHHEIAEVHAFIRSELGNVTPSAATVRILYGGSVNAKNAHEILPIANVDGALVGGASLDAASFWNIALCAGD